MKPSLPQGTRDFGSEVLGKRRFILNTIQQIFELYGFEPLETPAMENLETLTGKYGDEGDKLIFKILNNGLDNPAKVDDSRANFEKILLGKNDKSITERALRYDLTIPFARYVAMNFNKLTIPFKRYQIQPVWRADRPQKGRYREFYQCDADVAGSHSFISDVEFVQIYGAVFYQLKVEIDIKINNRKILAALAEVCGSSDKLTPITVIIDKLDKIGLEKVMEELGNIGLGEKKLELIEEYLQIKGDNFEKINAVSKIVGASEIGRKGIEELQFILEYIDTENYPVQIDFTLARGLNYYTGTIYEVTAKNVKMGSIGGGGRYDNLTGLFGVPDVPGVGISFGLDRIYDVMEELDLFPDDVKTVTKALFFNLGSNESKFAYKIMQDCRHAGISAEMFYENAKLEKQFKYASKKNISFAVIIGSEEMKSQYCVVKELTSGKQEKIEISQLNNYLKNK
jgi:histidyl-tRNA synthetase